MLEYEKIVAYGETMKYFISFITCFCLISFIVASNQSFELILEPRWDDLEHNADKEKQFGSKLILIGKITFKKKAIDEIKLNKISLLWHGQFFDSLSGSLYKKDPDKEFFPIEENVICDSTWNKEQQLLILNFKQAQKLGVHTEFYLVFSVPHILEEPLKKGHFSIEEKYLPEPLQDSAKKNELVIALGDTGNKRRVVALY